ncbi:MAG: hypothetical protein KKA55_06285 [Proteobacteria bacterium]|nr:hypothetical protein [Pseudomonadota bacterium]MBU1595129.1 hypothetical protein [Pseudomonadota bacterium]
MSDARFIADRGGHGSVCIRDTTRANRMACTFDRDFAFYSGDRDRATAAAMRMAEICAEALNAAHEARINKEGGNT